MESQTVGLVEHVSITIKQGNGASMRFNAYIFLNFTENIYSGEQTHETNIRWQTTSIYFPVLRTFTVFSLWPKAFLGNAQEVSVFALELHHLHTSSVREAKSDEDHSQIWKLNRNDSNSISNYIWIGLLKSFMKIQLQDINVLWKVNLICRVKHKSSFSNGEVGNSSARVQLVS